jgi:CBS domain-containing protein
MLCEDIMMDDVVCLSLTDTARDAACKMRDLNVGFLPVCDASGKVIGALTDRDLTIRLIAENLSAKTSVSTLMTPEVISCRPKDDIHRAQALMALHHKSRIVVVREGGRVAGVISLSDIAQNVDAPNAAQTMREVSERESVPVARRWHSAIP